MFDSGIGGCGLDQEGENSSVAATKGSKSKDSQREFFGVVASCWSGMGRLSVHVDTFTFVPGYLLQITKLYCTVPVLLRRRRIGRSVKLSKINFFKYYAYCIPVPEPYNLK